MSKDDVFEKMTKDIQGKIDKDEERDFSKIVIREYRNPVNFGTIKNADAVGIIKGPCGDTMKISLKIKNGKVIKARFWTDGCGSSIACGNYLTKMIKGKNIEKIKLITSNDLNEALMGLPDEHIHCTKLAVNSLQKALKNYNKN